MDTQNSLPIHKFQFTKSSHIFLMVLAAAVLLGIGSGYLLASGNEKSPSLPQVTNETPKTAQSDSRTFRDFAEGVVEKRPSTDEYAEGSHLLKRDGVPPVALTSSVVDLSQYEGKKVKVYGETQKAIKEGWLMDVGRVEVK